MEEQDQLQDKQDRLQGEQDRLHDEQDRLQEKQDRLQDVQYMLQDRLHDSRIGKREAQSVACRASRIGCRRSRIITGRAERQLLEQNSLYSEHIKLKKEQDDQARLLCSEGDFGIQHFDIHCRNWKKKNPEHPIVMIYTD
jgi:hypothetical protein